MIKMEGRGSLIVPIFASCSLQACVPVLVEFLKDHGHQIHDMEGQARVSLTNGVPIRLIYDEKISVGGAQVQFECSPFE
jgi:hypothetical protein